MNKFESYEIKALNQNQEKKGQESYQPPYIIIHTNRIFRSGDNSLKGKGQLLARKLEDQT